MIALPGIAVQDKIYESSNSLVYRGIRDDGSAIVVKILKQVYPSPQELTRYRQEYQITRSLNLEGAVKAYSQQDYQRTLVILLEDFGGESLEQWMRSHPETFCPMPLSTFLRLAIELTDILGRIHAAHVIHKDINPGNIVLNLDTGVVKIIDFGIATQFSRTNPTFKSPHVLEGTLAYLSPEQTGRMNRSLDYRTDFYSLGVTFYELVTGHLPFPATNILELVHCHIAKQPVPPHEVNAAIPKPISDIILKLMAKNAEDRYQSAWGIKADLELCDRQLAEIGRIDRIQLMLQDVSDRFQIPQKLYGRDKEVALLLAAFVRVASPENKNNSETRFKVEMMLVSGYAGIGKSALVQELYKPITAKRGYFISGKFDQFQRNIPYSAIIDALRKLMQQLLGERDDRVKQWRSQILNALGSNGQLMIDVIPEVGLIIGKQPPVPEVGATEAQNRFNRVFQQFIRVFCSEEHPLAIFLDDLQWIDSATLKLIELMLLDEQAQSLFLIGAYRDNEVTPTHPLSLTLSELRKQGAVLQEIVLSPLTLEPLSQLIAETLHQNTDTVRSLAELVLRKTEGNPFFVSEFLRLLYSENLLSFNAEHLSWQWNVAQIQAQNITDNVVELMLIQLKKLPESTQQMLQLAACIGAEFDLETLAIVCEKSPQVVSLDLLVAIQAGLIQPLSELDENLLVQEYKFLHDRVQQAAYALIDESQKQVVHLQIGRNLLEKTLPEQLSERLFEIVDHLNHGIELVSGQANRNEIARLNLLAGQKAKGAIAYSTARNYLTTGRQWLEVSSWQTNYDLTLELYVETTEVAYLCGEFEQVEYWAEIVLQSAKTIFDSVKVCEVRIQTDIAQNQSLKAINTALQVVHQLGINFPKTPSQSDIRLELDTITALFNEKEVESLIDLPEMTEPSKLAAMRILSSITIAAQIAAPNLIPLLAAKQVNLSIQYGNAFVSPFAYATFGLILCGMIGNIETGYQFGQLALNLLSQSHTHALKARTLLIVNDFIIHWKKHIRELLQPLLEGYQIGLETGDLESAAYCAHTYCAQSYINGKELVEVERDMVTYSEAIHHIKQETSLTWNQIFRQAIINLRGGSLAIASPWRISSTRLIGESYNEEIELPQFEAANDGSTIFIVHFNKLFLCYLFSEYAQAVENAALAETYLIRLTGSALEPLYYLYDSLARLATYLDSSTQVRSEILKKVAVSQEKMKHWADHAPMNYLHKYHLVEAETARVLGQLLEAEEFYERAIQGAKDNEYLQEEALAYELTAKFYLERSRSKIAQTYMKEAHYCYERWGAIAKVKDLETRYPQFFPQSSDVTFTPIHATSGTTSTRLDSAVDLATVMKAAQALSEIIHLDRLIATLMQGAIENVGAERGALILLEDDRLTVSAQCSGSNQCDPEKLAVADCATIPVSVIHSVERTQETLVLDDAVSEPSFSTDSYIQHQQTRSLLCMPILKQGQLIGILYLENNLSPGVFTRDRLQVLKLLMAQAAISLENARLYEQLEDYAETLERKVEERTQALQQEICDRKQAEEALQRSETKFRNIFENSQVGIFRVRLSDGLLLDANQRHANLFGFDSPEEIIGLEHVIGYYADPSDHQHLIELLKRDREVRSFEAQMRKRDGTLFWGLFSLYLNADDDYIEGVIADISDRKQAEAALQTSEERLRLALTASNQGLYDMNLKTEEIVVNPEYALMLGYDPATFHETKSRWVESLHPDDRESMFAVYNGFMTGEAPNYQAEYRLRTRDGQWKWILSVGKIVTWNESGEPIRALGVYTDIDDLKRAEAALQASEAELRAFFAAIPDPLFVLTAEGRVIEAVEVGTDQLYKPIEEQVGKTLHEIFSQAQADEFLNYIHQVLSTQQMLTVEYYLLMSGQKTWFSTRIAPIRTGQVIWLARDITDRKRAEAASILEERNRMAREIHDTLAQAFTGILAQVGAANQVLTDDVEATQAHLDLIKELARTGLVEARRSVVALRPQLLEEGSLQSALHRLIAQIRAAANDTTLHFEIEGTVYFLPTEVESNLLRIGQESLTNAMRHANADEIRVELKYDRDRVCLSVKDNGQGFGVGSIPSFEGFGLLGMSERAERIGAQLTIRSQPGQGTEIIVTVNQESSR